MTRSKSVCLIAGGMGGTRLRLQPWRYLLEVGRGLARGGYAVTILTDYAAGADAPGALDYVPVRRLGSVSSPRWGANRALQGAIGELDPQVIIWHLGLTSLLHQSTAPFAGRPSLGVFTSPLYRWDELARLGLLRLLRHHRSSAVLLLASLLPAWALRLLGKDIEDRLSALVVQTKTTRRRLLERGVWDGRLEVIPPGVDQAWLSGDGDREAARRSLGFSAADTVVVYFGPPDPLRGLPALLSAFAIAHSQDAHLRLLILARRQNGGAGALGDLVCRMGMQQAVRTVEGILEPGRLAGLVGAGDLAALPFEMAPSDAPLSILEARALGMPLITTRVACLPELAGRQNCYLVEPCDPPALAQAILHSADMLRCDPPRVMDGSQKRTWDAVGGEWMHLLETLPP